MIQLPAGARHEHEGTEQGQGEGQQEAWHSELQLTVPSLGEIRVALWLQETHLRLQLLAREEGSLSVLKRGLPQLEQRLEEAGLSPVLIDAGPWEGGAMDGGGADDGAEA
nr:flagellar hook-length control protein FliK [Halomonas sp. MCCC 1A17488]